MQGLCRTLPSNLALCVHPELTYLKVKNPKTGKVYIAGEYGVSQIPGAVKKTKGKKTDSDVPPTLEWPVSPPHPALLPYRDNHIVHVKPEAALGGSRNYQKLSSVQTIYRRTAALSQYIVLCLQSHFRLYCLMHFCAETTMSRFVRCNFHWSQLTQPIWNSSPVISLSQREDTSV